MLVYIVAGFLCFLAVVLVLAEIISYIVDAVAERKRKKQVKSKKGEKK